MIPPDSKRLRRSKRLRHDDAQTKDRIPPDSKRLRRSKRLRQRWKHKHLWKRIPSLILHSSDFSSLKIFTKFVSRILSLRDDSIPLRALSFQRKGHMELPLLNRILKYAISHNIQRLGLTLDCEIEQISSPIFSFQTLTHLSLCNSRKDGGTTLFPKSLNLPALTSLDLWNFAFCADNDVADPFLTFNKLNCLFLYQCDVKDALTLRISSSMLVRLSMYYHYPTTLKMVELCTPSLYTFVFTGVPHMRFKGSNISFVEHVDIDANLHSLICVDPAFNLLNWLLDFVGIKSLVLTASTLQLLSFIPDLLKDKLPFLENLKSLKVFDQELPHAFSWFLKLAKLQKAKSLSLDKASKQTRKEEREGNFTHSSPLPDGIVDFLL